MRAGTPAHLRDLRVGAVVHDGPITYKILSKSPGSVRVLRTERVAITDASVMPPVEVWTEQSTKVNVAPTARLMDFRGRVSG